MRQFLIASVGAAALMALPAFAETPAAKAHPKAPHMQPITYKNAMLAPWTGAYGGYPRFDLVKVSDFKPALEEAMDLNRREIAAIANNPAKPTFANTIEALELAGQPLNRVGTFYGVWGSNLSTPEYQKVQN